jgi:outer membrane protein assembly factor BamB
LVVGLSGKLLGLNPLNGTSRWETVIASPRGTNDVERLVDMVGPAYRDADVLCVRSFEAGIGCVNAARGSLIWRKTVSGSAGLHGDDKYVFGVEGDGTLTALRRGDGEKGWTTDALRFRRPGSPMVAGRSVVLGDSQGYLHFLSREDGATLARVTTDNSGILLAPLMSGTTLIAVTRNGGIYGFRPK